MWTTEKQIFLFCNDDSPVFYLQSRKSRALAKAWLDVLYQRWWSTGMKEPDCNKHQEKNKQKAPCTMKWKIIEMMKSVKVTRWSSEVFSSETPAHPPSKRLPSRSPLSRNTCGDWGCDELHSTRQEQKRGRSVTRRQQTTSDKEAWKMTLLSFTFHVAALRLKYAKVRVNQL